MLKLESDQFPYSKIEFVIGGVTYYIYNTECLEPFVKNFNANENPRIDISVNVLYLVHHREGNYTYTEAIGKHIINEFSKSNSAPLIAVTFDGRNHGARKINELGNASWGEGNETHGVDMTSCIRGNDYDVKLCIDFLPAHLNLERFLNETSKENEIKINFNNILSGYSVGGHSVIRFANRFPDLVSIINPNVGCADLTSLLINRLKGTADFNKKYFYYKYDELKLTEDQKSKYPEYLHLLISTEDTEIFGRFPFEKIAMFGSFYSDDPLVPSKISESWIKMYLNTNSDSEVYYENGAIHDITPLMITKFAQWLAKKIL